MSGKILNLLIAEDSDDDFTIVHVTLRKVPRLRLAWIAGDGDEAIAYLAGLGDFFDRGRFPYPDLLLLDLKLPLRDGFAVLEWLRAQPCRPRVVVLTDCSEESIKQRVLTLGADIFQTKFAEPVHLAEFLQRVCEEM